MIFDIYSPLHLWVNNLQTARFGVRSSWGFWRGEEIEKISGGLRQLDEWAYIDEPDERIAYLRWLRPLEHLVKTHRIYCFRLGKTFGDE